MNEAIYTVSQLNQSVAELLELEFAWVTVEGEISSISRPASGHLYFTLKDDSAKVECVMFRSSARGLTFEPDTGVQVQLRAKVSVYQPWGKYQLTVDRMEEAGAGALQQQFEALKRKLAAEGLFDSDSKREVPEHASGIALITSSSGAAVRDVISVVQRRFPLTPVHLYPVTVQGERSGAEICHALELADADADCDVILLVRGGGSIEDLWSFNEERVARAIHACATPVVSGVGHEIDVTIADFVADLRAATPTAAAEAVTPDQQTWFQTLDWYSQRLEQLLADQLTQQQQRLDWLKQRLQQQHPATNLQRMQQRLHDLSNRMQLHASTNIRLQQGRLAGLREGLLARSPDNMLQLHQQQLAHFSGKLQDSIERTLERSRSRLASQASTLQALSPLQTLARGYSISLGSDGKAILNSNQLSVGAELTTRLSQGSVVSIVKSTDDS